MGEQDAEQAAPREEAAARVNRWLDQNWKYVSDDLLHDLRLLSTLPDSARP